MKIKSIEDFTLEECQERLLNNPTPLEREQLNQRIDELSCQEKVYQERLKHNVKWVDYKEFLDNNNNVINTDLLLFFAWLALICGSIEALGVFMIYGASISGILFAFGIVGMAVLGFLCIKKAMTKASRFLYNIEANECITNYLRAQSKDGLYSLLRLERRYKNGRRDYRLVCVGCNNIYVCGDDAYICVKGDKCGVYNTSLKKMVLPVAYDDILIQSDGTLLAKRDGNQYYFTTKGYRVVK